MKQQAKVLPPWTPVAFEHKGLVAKARVWGREYEFNESLFPTAVETAGRSILAAPMQLHAFFEGKEAAFGKTVMLAMEEETTEAKAVFAVSQTAENILLNGRVSVEYDGFVKIDFNIIPFWGFAKIENNVPRLDGLYLDIPIKKEYAPLYHFWPNDDSGGIYPNHFVVNSGYLPEGGTALPFKPYVWSGWEYGGLGICAETDENIEISNRKKAVEWIEEADRVIIRLHLLDQIPAGWQGRVDQWVDTLKPIDYSIGIQATPVKEIPQKMIEEWRPYGNITAKAADVADIRDPETGKTLIEELVSGGVKWLILHETWSAIQNYGLAEDADDIKRIAEVCHANGIKLMLYFGYECSTLAPCWHEKADEMLLKVPNGSYAGGWQRRLQPQRAYIACYRGDYGAVMRERVAHAMDVYGADGIYTDGTFIPWECANEAHGCGYRDREGVLHTTYPVFAVREHVKQLYELVHERGGVVDTHQSACCIAPTLAFCDSYYDGENIQDALKQGMEFLSLDAFRAEYMGKNLGLPAQFLAEVDENFTIETVSSMTLLHDVHVRIGKVRDLHYVSKIWKAFEAFGTGDAEWIPYYEADVPLKPLQEKVYCSVYRKGHELLAVVTGTDAAVKQAELEAGCKIISAESCVEAIEPQLCGESRVRLPLEPYHAQIIKLVLEA